MVVLITARMSNAGFDSESVYTIAQLARQTEKAAFYAVNCRHVDLMQGYLCSINASSNILPYDVARLCLRLHVSRSVSQLGLQYCHTVRMRVV